jgi:hydroxymethylpyrimidine pyrophosphatase-like HAD family hydrolase
VDAVVAENGAVGYWIEGGSQRTLIHPSQEGEAGRLLLDNLWKEIAVRFPGARKASDQHTRLYDLAIDYAEDEPRMSRAWAEGISAFARDFGACASVSSTHINIASASYGKGELAATLASRLFGITPIRLPSAVAAIGDSANDQALFERFPLSFGVANISASLPYMERLPRFVTEAAHGRGFSEFAHSLVESRKALSEKK